MASAVVNPDRHEVANPSGELAASTLVMESRHSASFVSSKHKCKLNERQSLDCSARRPTPMRFLTLYWPPWAPQLAKLEACDSTRDSGLEKSAEKTSVMPCLLLRAGDTSMVSD
jgi:hypothetical protein